jgi:nickel transport protein
MKSFLDWGRKLGLVGGLVVGTLLVSSLQVWALTKEQVIERLRTVPVFTLANGEGSPLLAVPTQGESRMPIASVFINRDDAQKFLDDLKTRDPQTAQGISVVPVPLAKIYEYEVAQQTKAETEQVRFAFFPDAQQVEAAKALLQQQGQSQQFEGVPLFVAKENGQEGGYLTIQQGSDQVIPMFFEQSELQTLLTRLREVQPNMATSVQMQVVNLEGVINTLQTSNNEELNRIVLVPSQQSREFIRSLQGQQGTGQPAGQPASGGTAPAARPQAQPASPQAQPARPR